MACAHCVISWLCNSYKKAIDDYENGDNFEPWPRPPTVKCPTCREMTEIAYLNIDRKMLDICSILDIEVSDAELRRFNVELEKTKRIYRLSMQSGVDMS